jgi:hypothetical protein
MSEEVLRISVADLRAVFEGLIAGLDDEVEVSADYFWSVPTAELTDVYQEPRQLTIGQVSEAWSSLLAMKDDESTALTYGLVWLADVLKVIGSERMA